MNVLAPELSALMTIFRSVGPVISTLQAATRQQSGSPPRRNGASLAEEVEGRRVRLTGDPRVQDLAGRMTKLEKIGCRRSRGGRLEPCPITGR